MQCINRGCTPMPIIFYTDASSPDFKRSLALKPIVISAGNLVGSVTRTTAGKRCIGYWPKLKVSILRLFMYVHLMMTFA